MAMRLNRGGELVIATHNPGKFKEFRDFFEPLGLTIWSAAGLGVPEAEETGDSFEENAKLKAAAAVRATAKLALADDSGLAVDALDGAPGVYSARWAGEPRDFFQAMRRLHGALEAKGITALETVRARFVCVLCLANPMGEVQFFRGTVEGHLTWPPRGTQGFGYDPMFVPDGFQETFGEMDPVKKHPISHRARAFAGFKAAVMSAID
ncbi:MAG TPA: RdgB/HAM1 family non-canonical purine NTP pyrophosphatase [Hyphomicrobiales bacterium]|nr:RdgB/HAM1 family non-canonical purine NTP pyrophosphatase [Hyphomicrobiales bacterium]